MKVLLAWKGPRASERAFVARRQIPLLLNLIAQGVQPTVALLGDPGGLRADLEAHGVAVEKLNALPPPASTLPGLPAVVKRLRQIVDALGPDIVEGDEPLPAIMVGLAMFRRPGPVVTYRRHFYGNRPQARIPSLLAARLADRMIVSCEAMRRYVAASDAVPIETIDVSTSGTMEPPALAAPAISDARRSLGIADDDRVIGVVSNLRRQKGIDVLLRALGRMSGTSNIHVVIAGSGPAEAALRRLARSAPVPVHFVGHRDDVHLWIAIADVMAMPSRGESFGRATLEMMAVGRPLVASRVGGLADAVIDGETGLLVPAGDVDALAAALTTILGDRQRALRMGQMARARYESKYTMAHMATAWRQAWERALVSGGRAPS